jgi:hypothetical protein
LVKDEVHKAHMTAVAIEGPYGRLRPLRQFDSVVLIAGGSGSTFTMPLLRDLVLSWKTVSQRKTWSKIFETPVGAATRSIRFVWIVKSKQQLEWFAAQLTSAAQEVEQLNNEGHDFRAEISVYVTCDEILQAQEMIPSQPTPKRRRSVPNEVTTSVESLDAPEKVKSSSLSIHSAVVGLDGEQTRDLSCGLNGACCCTGAIDDEKKAVGLHEECLCNKGNKENRSKGSAIESLRSSGGSSLSVSREKANGHPVDPAITVLSGRPCPKIIIQRTIEQARGESAVVVCGPPGLVDDVRQSVVSLSDERAAHKGTGAQGIYLRTEAFDY